MVNWQKRKSRRPQRLPALFKEEEALPFDSWIEPRCRIDNNPKALLSPSLQSQPLKTLSRGDGLVVDCLSPTQAVTSPLSSSSLTPLPARNFNSLLSCNRTQPRNLNCEICRRLASYSSDVLQCVYCNVVCHIECLQHFQHNFSPTKSNLWVCFLCIDELDASKTHFDGQLRAKQDYKLHCQAQTTIAKEFRRYRARKFYIRIYTVIVRLQIMFNIRRRKKAFLFNTQAKLRPMKVMIHRCRALYIPDREAAKAMGEIDSYYSMELMTSSSQVDSVEVGIKKTQQQNHHHHSSGRGSGPRGRERESHGVQRERDQCEGDDDDEQSIHSVDSSSSLSTIATSTSVHRLSSQRSVDSSTARRQTHGSGSGAKSQLARTNRKDYEVYALITVMDESRGEAVQSWRLQSSIRLVTIRPNRSFDVVFDEALMIGGVSGFNSLVLSVFCKASSARDIFLGQCHIDLSQNYLWRTGGRFVLPLDSVVFDLKDNVGMDMKADFRHSTHGHAEFSVTTYRGMSSECGYCLATSPEDILRLIGKSGDFHGYRFTHAFPVPSTTSSSSTSSSTLQRISSHDSVDDTASTHSGLSLRSRGSNTKSTTNPSNGRSKGGTMLLTPFRDVHAFPLKKAWIAIAEGYIFIYNHFGDPLKLCVDLSQFQFSFDFRDKVQIVFQLSRLPQPAFIFVPTTLPEMLRWKCAFLSSIHTIRTSNESTSTSDLLSSSLSQQSDVKFDVSYLINDLLALDQLQAMKFNVNCRLPSARRSFQAHPLMCKDLCSDQLAIPLQALPAPPTVSVNDSIVASRLVDEVKSGSNKPLLNVHIPSQFHDEQQQYSHHDVSPSAALSTIIVLSASTMPPLTQGAHLAAETPNARQVTFKSPKASKSPTVKFKHGTGEESDRAHSLNDSRKPKNKNLMSYKPKERVDVSQSLQMVVPTLSSNVESGSSKGAIRQLALSSVLNTGASDESAPPDPQSSAVRMQQTVSEDYELDSIVMNPKYQQYGEQLVSKLLSGRNANQYVKPLRTPKASQLAYNHSHHAFDFENTE